jgi:hypothetical protein
MKLGTDHAVPPSACIHCGHILDMATSVNEIDDDPDPEAGAFTICIDCGHIMAIADDLTLRDLTDKEIVMVAGDKRIIAIQWARASIEYKRAYIEDHVRTLAKKYGHMLTHEKFNEIVDETLEAERAKKHE